MTMRFIHENLYPLLATLVIMAAVICWFGTPEPAHPKTLAPVDESWSLPKAAAHDSKKFIETINARNLWGVVEADATKEAPKEPEWHVLGIAISGADRFILLTIDGKPVEMLKVGDALPDGAKIMQIEKDQFFVMTPDKKKLSFGINKHDQAK